MQGIWNVLKERSSVYVRRVIGGKEDYSPGQNAEMYETQCQTQNVWQHITSKRPLGSHSANESSVTNYDTWYEDQ